MATHQLHLVQVTEDRPDIFLLDLPDLVISIPAAKVQFWKELLEILLNNPELLKAIFEFIMELLRGIAPPPQPTIP